MQEWSVLVVDGQSSFALSVIRCLGSAPGVTVHVLSRRRQAPAARSRYVASASVCDSRDDVEYLSQIAVIAERTGAAVCLAVDEPAIRLFGEHSAFLSTRLRHGPVPAIETLDTVVDKWMLACFLHEHGLPHPVTSLCKPTSLGLERNGAVLLKPRKGGNGLGILRLDGRDAIDAYISSHAKICGEYIVQDFVAGTDIDCSVLCDHGEVRAHTIQQSFIPATGSFKPAGGIEFVDDADVFDLVQRLMSALRWHGVAHVDLRYDALRRQLYVIEINPRFWGSLLGSLHAGVNFPYAACLLGLDLPLPAAALQPRRFVAGNTAIDIWKQGKFGRRSAGFTLADTVFADVVRDPRPSMAELYQEVAKPRPAVSRRQRRARSALLACALATGACRLPGTVTSSSDGVVTSPPAVVRAVDNTTSPAVAFRMHEKTQSNR